MLKGERKRLTEICGRTASRRESWSIRNALSDCLWNPSNTAAASFRRTKRGYTNDRDV
jgi:hypothetical protein